jgi:hypothetical protein
MMLPGALAPLKFGPICRAHKCELKLRRKRLLIACVLLTRAHDAPPPLDAD